MTYELRQRLEHITVLVLTYSMGFFSGVLVAYGMMKIRGVLP